MGRRKKIAEEIAALETKVNDLKQEAEQIDQKRLNDLQELNDHIESRYGAEYFCGVVITPQDLLTITQIMLNSKENVQIPINLYLKED